MLYSTLMVRLAPGGSNDSILSFAADAAGRLEPTRIIGICACQPLRIHANPYMYLPYDMIDENRLHIEKEMGAAENRFRNVVPSSMRAARSTWPS